MPPPSEASQRYDVIDRCLLNIYNKFPSLEDLKRLIEKELDTEVSTETIQKDIAFMKKSIKEGGFEAPILFKKANRGYCYTDPEYTIRKYGFNEKSLEILELAVGLLKRFEGITGNNSFNHALNKLYASLNIEKTSKDINLSNAILPQETTFLRGMEHFQTFVDGIKFKTPISFIHYSYSKNSNKEKNKKVKTVPKFKAVIIHPYLLKESNERWYLVGFSESHGKNGELRYFGVDRIYDPILIEKEFIENKETDLRELFGNKIGLNPILKNKKEIPEVITIRVSDAMSNYIKSMPLHKSQVIESYGLYGEIQVSLTLVPTKELVSLILSYGEHMEVIEPNWLRKHIKNELALTSEKYNSKPRSDYE